MIRQQQRIMSNERQLALTAALEHFTATLAELLLREPKARQLLGHEAARQVFVWHALEESEHKAVAFDVYRAIGGSERIRVQVMRQTRFLFVAVTAFQVALAVLADPKSRQRGVLRQSIWRFRRSPLWDRSVWEQLKDYDRPDFHPDDSDTSELVAEWREALFGVSGELQDNLSTSAA
jgi:predicted metal-dependent hydrolase